VPKPEKNYET